MAIKNKVKKYIYFPFKSLKVRLLMNKEKLFSNSFTMI